MGGGVLQLALYGGQDKETIGNPQISFFRCVYKRHSNFAIETIEQPFTSGNISKNECTVNAIIGRNGDLIHKMYLDVKFPKFPKNAASDDSVNAYNNWTNQTGHAYIKEANIYIGELLIDKHIGEWYDVWNELSDYYENEHLLVNKQLAKKAYLLSNGNSDCSGLQCYIPLKFWFNRYINSALPIIALQYHDVKLQFKFRALDFLVNTNNNNGVGDNNNNPTTKLLIDYVFLDPDERRMFANNSHKYLIEQLQVINKNLEKNNEIKFNHPVKELIWCCRNSNASKESTTNVNAVSNFPSSGTDSIKNGNDYFNYACANPAAVENVGGNNSNEPFDNAKLVFNGVDRFSAKKASYFRTIQPLNHHSRIPTKHIYCYSFSIKPENFQPSGSCNFSRIHNAYLQFDNITSDKTDLLVFATNYNILYIESGMGGLAYSN